MASDTDIAWAAGLFEGEGCFFATNKYERKSGTVRKAHSAQLGSSDLDVVERFQAIVGIGGIIRVKSKNPLHKQMWRWQIQSRSGLELLGELFRPYLGERRLAKLDEVLAVMATENDPCTCGYCGTEFVPLRRRRQETFCSRDCWRRFRQDVKEPRFGPTPIQEV